MGKGFERSDGRDSLANPRKFQVKIEFGKTDAGSIMPSAREEANRIGGAPTGAACHPSLGSFRFRQGYGIRQDGQDGQDFQDGRWGAAPLGLGIDWEPGGL